MKRTEGFPTEGARGRRDVQGKNRDAVEEDEGQEKESREHTPCVHCTDFTAVVHTAILTFM